MAGYLVKKGSLFSSQFRGSNSTLPASAQFLIRVMWQFISQWKSGHRKWVSIKKSHYSEREWGFWTCFITSLLKGVQSHLHKWALATGRKEQTTLKVPNISQHCYLGAKTQHSTQVIVKTNYIQTLGSFSLLGLFLSTIFRILHILWMVGKEMSKLTAVKILELCECVQWCY